MESLNQRRSHSRMMIDLIGSIVMLNQLSEIVYENQKLHFLDRFLVDFF